MALDQSAAPILAALGTARRSGQIGFGAPGHGGGRLIPRGLRRLLGSRVYGADLMTPKGLEDRTESAGAVQRAHEIAAEAWGADLCRFSTGGSTQSIQTLLAAVARPGDTVLLAANAHKAEFAAVLVAGLTPAIIPVAIDAEWDLEHGVTPDALAAACDRHPGARAAVVVSPTYYGATSDVAALAAVAHGRGVPLIIDAAWGGAFGFSPRLPANPLAQGADAMVVSLHKTMGALAQGSVMLARGDRIDQQRIALAYELFQTTSPSVPILASIDACRRDHVARGARLWGDTLDLAADARTRLAAIDGLAILNRDRVQAAGMADLDESKILIDVARWGVAGYALDDWLAREHQVSVGLSDMRHLLVILSPGKRRRDVNRLVRGLADAARRLRETPDLLPAAPIAVPPVGSLAMEWAMPPGAAFFAAVETVRYEDSAGRIAAEILAPAPPGTPRLMPGQRITETHRRWLTANRDAGMFVLDPTDPAERRIRVVRA